MAFKFSVGRRPMSEQTRPSINLKEEGGGGAGAEELSYSNAKLRR